MNIVVTGGAGYIGAHVVRELAALQHRVCVIDNLSTGHRVLAERAGAARLVVGDCGDAALLDEVLGAERPEAVLHFAAAKAPGESMLDPAKYFQNNVVKTLALLDAMRRHGCTRFVFSSTCAVYGQVAHVPVTEDNNRLQPESPYGESKLMVERILQWYDRAYGLKSSRLRYFNAAGAALDGALGEDWSRTTNLIPLVMKAALGRSPAVQVFGTDYPTADGTCIRDYIHVVDLALAHVRALDHLHAHGRSSVYNLGTGRGHSVKEVITLARQVTGRDIPVQETGRRPGDPITLWADSTRAYQELDWRPRYDLETIIRTAFAWHRANPDGLSDRAPAPAPSA